MSDELYAWYVSKNDYIREYLQALKNREETFNTGIKLITPSMYKAAVKDFMKFGSITHFPEKHIFAWKEWVLHNIIALESFNDLSGHSQDFPFDEFNDVFLYSDELENVSWQISDYDEACTIMEEHGGEELFPTWSNGHYMISDYGIQPLLKIGGKLIDENNPSTILRLIDQALNISHMRSDLAELFMKGGSKELTLLTS